MLFPMERPPGGLSPSDRALIVRLGAVGDVLRAIPAVTAIRKGVPGIRIAWLVEDLARPLLEGHPDIDQLFRFPRRDLGRAGRHPGQAAAALRRMRQELRGWRATVAIDLQSSLKSGLASLLSAAPRRVGFAPPFCRELNFLFTNEWAVPASRWLNRVERNLQLVQALGVRCDPIEVSLPEAREEGDAATAILNRLVPGPGPVVLISPGTSALQGHKMWPAEHYARLAVLLHDATGARPIVVWGPREESLAGRIVQDAGTAAILASAVDLRLLAALLRRSDLFIGADTGPMHLAWVVGCRVIALFGPTDPRLNAPLGRGNEVVRSSDREMASIRPEVVAAAARRMLDADAVRNGPAPELPARAHPRAGAVCWPRTPGAEA
jgi:ADP-heptose:LPS heptosyltransferase